MTERPELQRLDQNEVEPLDSQPPPTSSQENINDRLGSINAVPRRNKQNMSGRFNFWVRSSLGGCHVKGCGEPLVHEEFPSGKRVKSIHCEDHTCKCPRNRQSGFCKNARNPKNEFCKSHGGCTTPGCTRVAPRQEKDPPWPYICPMHRDLSCSEPQSCPLADRELNDRPGEGASGTHTDYPGGSGGAGGSNPTFHEHSDSGELEHPEGGSNITGHTLVGWAIIRARCSYAASSSQEVGFSCHEVFFATSWKEDKDRYEVYTRNRPNATGFVPVSSFDTFLSGSCENGVVPWDDLELFYVMIYGDFVRAQQLLQHHPELANTRRIIPPIEFAAGLGSTVFVLLLIINGADANLSLNNGETALTFALKNGLYDSAITLRAFGAGSWDRQWTEWRQEPDSQEPNSSLLPSREKVNNILAKWTARNTVLLQNEVSQKSLSQFAVQDGYNFAEILIWGINDGKPHVVDYVLHLCDVWPLDYRASVVNHVKPQGWTPLHYAVETNQGETVEKLIERGARLDITTSVERWTPLQLAASKGQQSSMKALLNCDANVFAKTPAGKTALDLAQDSGHQETLRILVQYCHQRLATCNEVEEVLPHDAVRNYDDGRMFGSSPVRSHHTMTETIETKRESGVHTQALESTGKGGQAAVTEGDFSTNDSADGGFDGSIFSSPVTGSLCTQSRAFNKPIEALQSGNFEFTEDDERVKIAILDTGIDLTHYDWQHGRIVEFKENGEHRRENNEPRQWTRIMDFRNFCNPGEAEKERDVMDHHGHGTQVAGIILRLAPRAEIYVARVCGGGSNRSTSTTEPKAPEAITGIRHEAVVEAIDWAIKQGVHLINMSFGFSRTHKDVDRALKRAREANIVTFAAMSNDGNNRQDRAAWPARNPALTIGIHSCKNEHGMDRSGFTPPAVPNSDNFMAVGEGIITHWPESKGGGFRMDEGTSFATPVVTAMASRILAFVMQDKCKKQRQEAEKEYGKSLILEPAAMAALLRKVSNGAGDYHYIHPELLWKGFNPRARGVQNIPIERRNYAWEVIRSVLE